MYINSIGINQYNQTLTINKKAQDNSTEQSEKTIKQEVVSISQQAQELFSVDFWHPKRSHSTQDAITYSKTLENNDGGYPKKPKRE